jgi:hypothetical protein
MPNDLNYCENCAVETEPGVLHSCYRKIDDLYFKDVVLDEFFVRCGLCPSSVGLSGLIAGGWGRLLSSSRIAPHMGYLCPECAVRLGL